MSESSGSSHSAETSDDDWNPEEKEKVIKRTKKQSTLQREKRPNIPIPNHDDFFKKIENNESSTPIDSSAGVELDSIESNIEVGNSGDTHSILIQKLTTISNQMNRQENETSEIKNELLVVKRLIAKVEVLLKSRREICTSSDSDTDFLETLKSYGLPIETKEKFDELEELKNENEKAKLVNSINNYFNFLSFCLLCFHFHFHFETLISACVVDKNKW